MKNRIIILLSFTFLSSAMALTQVDFKKLDEIVKESVANPSKNQRKYNNLWEDGVLTVKGLNYDALVQLIQANADTRTPRSDLKALRSMIEGQCNSLGFTGRLIKTYIKGDNKKQQICYMCRNYWENAAKYDTELRLATFSFKNPNSSIIHPKAYEYVCGSLPLASEAVNDESERELTAQEQADLAQITA